MTGYSRQVPGMSRTQIATRANLLRFQVELLTGACPDAFPVTEYIEQILQVALPALDFAILDDEEMGGLEGATWPDRLQMRLSNTVYEGAAKGERRARFTVAHELGHLFLHRGIPFARAVPTGVSLPRYECSEWQADEFAGALLMPFSLVKRCRTVLELMDLAEVSQQAAEVRLSKLNVKKPHGW